MFEVGILGQSTRSKKKSRARGDSFEEDENVFHKRKLSFKDQAELERVKRELFGFITTEIDTMTSALGRNST